MRILVTLPQDSPELLDIALYCGRHHLDLRRERWQFQTDSYEFHIIYATDLDRNYVNWMYMQWPNTFFEF